MSNLNVKATDLVKFADLTALLYRLQRKPLIFQLGPNNPGPVLVLSKMIRDKVMNAIKLDFNEREWLDLLNKIIYEDEHTEPKA